MTFIVASNTEPMPDRGPDVAYLLEENWNDYWTYETLYLLHCYDGEGNRFEIGYVKIGQFTWKEQKRPALPREFVTLDQRFFSLGQEARYYGRIRRLGIDVADAVYKALNDIVADEPLYLRAKEERVTGVSLMRSVTERTIFGQFRRVIAGGAQLTSYEFKYKGPKQLDETADPVLLQFSVEPSSTPPTNIHVIIGRNGVGKSFLLHSMCRALVYQGQDADKNGQFIDEEDPAHNAFAIPFANVLSVTFSAFDDFPLLPERRNALLGPQYTNVGLRQRAKTIAQGASSSRPTVTRDPNELATDFISSAKVCADGERQRRWRHALLTLASDPVFEEAQVIELSKVSPESLGRPGARLFRRLSAGHKIVLLTITKLVETVEERTLVLMDEPELHLHPPLLSAFLRALSDLMINRNGVAIVATHSPVVLQEVPRSCVWILRRHGGRTVAERPLMETFAEHVGNLTHEVFGLEVTRSGFHHILSLSIKDSIGFGDVLAKFGNQIGSEGRALLSAIVASRGTMSEER